MVDELLAEFQGMADVWESELESVLSSAVKSPADAAFNAAVDGLINTMPAGISGAASGSAVVGLPATGALGAVGASVASSAFVSGASALRSSLLGMTQRLSPTNFMSFDPVKLLQGSILVGDNSGTGADGKVNWFLKTFLKLLGLDSIVDLIKMKVSDGVETPRNQALNTVFNVLADGLPPWFWDVRIQDPVQGRKAGEEEDLKINDSNPDDYNERRYNLGPLVYLPLIQDLDKINTAENTGRGGDVMGLPDYDGNRNVMRAIGKARIFFRQPSDHWMGVNKYVITSSLLMPFWNVRNESLSYVDKWGLMALDGVTNVISDVD